MTALVTHKILTIEENILNIATEIVNDYSHKRHVDTTGDVFNLLDRNVIFDCIRDLISIIYPGSGSMFKSKPADYLRKIFRLSLWSNPINKVIPEML